MEKKLKLDWADLAVKATVLSACLAILAISVVSPIYLGAKIDNKIDDVRGELHGFRTEMYQESKDFRERWAAESKEFHGRLIDLEVRVRER